MKKKIFSLLTLIIGCAFLTNSLHADSWCSAGPTNTCHQNAGVCGSQCGVSYVAIGIGIAAVAATTVILIAASDSNSDHSH